MTVNKIDSNSTGLNIAYETTIGVLPATPVWHPLEPNTYANFGPTIKTTPREPINQSRQRKKGFVTDLDAAAGFNQDLTQTNMTRHLQAFFFAALREKSTTNPMNGTPVVFSGVDPVLGYETVGVFPALVANDLIMASGFGAAGNNGLRLVTTAAPTAVVVTPATVVEAAPPAGAMFKKIGHQFPASDITFTVNGAMSVMNSASAALLNLGLIPGEWVYVGGDSDAATPTSQHGYARASIITASAITFDKTDWAPAAEADAGKTVQVFVGDLLRTEQDPTLQQRYSATIERTLGNAGAGPQAEYVSGACANTLAINMPQANKISVDLTYVATDGFSRDGATGLMPGTRLIEPSTDAFNTSSDFARIKMSIVDPTTSNVTPLFAYLTDVTLNLSNNVTPNKALGTLGAFDASAGMFTADGKITAYFVDTDAVLAVRNNSDVTLDIVMSKNNAGMIFDIPLISLGGGQLAVAANAAITIPLDAAGAQSVFGHTMVYQNFQYLPSAAQ